MPVRWAVASGNFSNLAIWNDSASLGLPTASDDIWANNNNINIDQSFSAISLNNSARARDIATPQMTSNSSPSPFVIFASSTAGGNNEPWRAFDRGVTPGTGVGWSAASGQLTGSIGVDFGSGNSVVIDAYDIVGYNQVIYNPRNWTLEGSNNNISWNILHTVTLPTPIGNSATYSVGSIGNTTAYRYYRINVTLNGGTAPLLLTEILLYQPGTAALAAGGSFIFNSGSISGSATSTTAALSQGTTGLYLVQVTATTGTVTLNLSSNVEPANAGNIVLINHSGNCNLNLNGQNFRGTSGGGGSPVCIGKSSAGTITVTGNLIGTTGAALSSTNGNTILTGNVIGGTGGAGHGILQTAGNVTVTGNVTAGSAGFGINLTGAASQFTIIGNVTGGTSTNAVGINFTGTSGSVTGTVTGGAGTSAHGISTSGVVNVTGNVNGGSVGAGIAPTANVTIIGNVTGGTAGGAISTASNISMTVTGTVTAGTVQAISSTSTGTVLLTGNMLNVAGRQAIFAQNLFISDTATTQWRLFTPGGQDKTLYSADTFPNQPSSANVRSGSLFGPSNVLSGSMVVPSPSDVRVNVLTDNTVGTGQSLTAADFLAAISASADPYAQRLRNVATVDTVGSLLTGFNNGGF
jgi:hypothetical protein